jgi:hypothetical protein
MRNNSAKGATLANDLTGSNIPGFYMGKNTPERKDYIMENLVVPVEE